MKHLSIFLASAPTLILASRTFAAGILYSPVVSEVGDGSFVLGSEAPNPPVTGVTTTIQVYQPTLANQPAPVSQLSFASGSLVSVGGGPFAAQLTNNPALTDAAAKGQAYNGTGYAYISGYAAADDTNAVNNANRVVGYAQVNPSLISSATIGVSQSSTTAYQNLPGSTTGRIFGATGNDSASNFWATGKGAVFTGGYRYMNNNTLIDAADIPSGGRTVQIRSNQLYGDGMDAAGQFQFAILKIGSGTPTTGGQGSSTVFTTGNLITSSPLAFVLIDDPNNSTPSSVPFNIAYIADDSANNSGIQKWVFNSATPSNNGWSLAYTINGSASEGYYGLAGQLVGTSVVLYATSDLVAPTASLVAGSENSLEQFTDPLESGSASSTDSTKITLATAPANYSFQGVALAIPEPSSLALLSAATFFLCIRRARPSFNGEHSPV